jgi:predicted HicB family RNase H-like nuclease
VEVIFMSKSKPKRKAEWQNNYIAKTYDRINLLVPKGTKETIKVLAESNGESLNGFVNRAIEEAMGQQKKASD